jgi:dTDP-glucose 4,6-dehydratase
MNKRLLLTGGAGFIGHHTVEHLLKNTDWEIVILDRLTYAGNQNYLTDLDCWEKEHKRVSFIYHDFRSPFSTTTLNLIGNINFIIHMGAETHVDNSIREPLIFAETNVIGTVNVLEAARKLSPEKMIYVSTDEVYGTVYRNLKNSEYDLHKEGEPLHPTNPYSASKAGAEAFCYAYWNTYGLRVMITNTMNNFGERQHLEKFVPKTVRAILKGEKVTIHVKIENEKIVDISSRCWLHARNHADGILFLLNSYEVGINLSNRKFQQYNITGEWANVKMMAEKIGKIIDKPIMINPEDFHSFRPGHDMHYGLDGSKLQQLGWRAPFSLDESLERTVEWMVKNPKWLE